MTNVPAAVRRSLSCTAFAAAAAVPPPPQVRHVAPSRSTAEPVLTEPRLVFDWSDVGVGALGGAGAALLATGGTLYALRRSSERSSATERKSQ